MIKVMNMLYIFLVVILLAGCTSASSGTNDQVSFYIQNKGSDTMVNLALAWAEAYQQVQPSVSVSVTGGGSGTGIAALINKTVDIANASRQIKDEEINDAKANGVEPFETVVARDAIAIIVHPENPINQLTLQQVSDIYSGKINNWLEIGGDDRPIVRLSRETNSGTHVYFLETVIRMDNKESDLLFDQRTLLLPSSEGITSEVSSNPNAIGYDGLGYVTDTVKVVAISGDTDGPYVVPSAESVNAGTYPISRDLYVYTNGEPKGAVKAYLEWILSNDAQDIVTELGFVPALP
jgi:phosphate transport system substrate-binding protein